MKEKKLNIKFKFVHMFKFGGVINTSLIEHNKVRVHGWALLFKLV